MSQVVKRFSGSAGWMAMCVTMVIVGTLGASTTAVAQDAGADVAQGRALFDLCTQCHGENGGGIQDALAPAIAGLPAWYVESQLVKFRAGQRGLHAGDTGGLRMYPMSKWLQSDDEIKAVAAYVSNMPAVEPAATLAEGDAAKGAGYYAVCSACHGPDGSGNQGMGAPPLTGLNDWYLLTSIEKYKKSIRGSLPGDTLGPAMIGMVATLPDEQAVRDVIAHIRSLAK